MTVSVADLFAQYHASLVRMLFRRTGDRERAEEIAQEVFARAVTAAPRSPRPWLFAVALNLVREEARTATRRDRRLVLYKAEQPSSAEAPDVLMGREERIAGVRAALEMLSPRDREALLLKAEGFSYDEIARTVGLSLGAVGTTLARARRKLVEAYRAGTGDPDQEGRRDSAS
jgi:RNA polymerase sigma factor (sigma-70 family)